MKSSKKKSVRIPAFAKINVCLHVMGKRPDGYHELRTIFQTISLADSLELLRVSEPGITLETNDAELPTGAENLVCRAIDAIACETGSDHRHASADEGEGAAGAIDRNCSPAWGGCAIFSIRRAGAGGESRR
jgi:hypothetical protein